MTKKILKPTQDQAQVIILNQLHMGSNVSQVEFELWIKILREKYHYNVQAGPFDGLPKQAIKSRHWCAAQDQVSQLI